MNFKIKNSAGLVALSFVFGAYSAEAINLEFMGYRAPAQKVAPPKKIPEMPPFSQSMSFQSIVSPFSVQGVATRSNTTPHLFMESELPQAVAASLSKSVTTEEPSLDSSSGIEEDLPSRTPSVSKLNLDKEADEEKVIDQPPFSLKPGKSYKKKDLHPKLQKAVESFEDTHPPKRKWIFFSEKKKPLLAELECFKQISELNQEPNKENFIKAMTHFVQKGEHIKQPSDLNKAKITAEDLETALAATESKKKKETLKGAVKSLNNNNNKEKELSEEEIKTYLRVMLKKNAKEQEAAKKKQKERKSAEKTNKEKSKKEKGESYKEKANEEQNN